MRARSDLRSGAGGEGSDLVRWSGIEGAGRGRSTTDGKTRNIALAVAMSVHTKRDEANRSTWARPNGSPVLPKPAKM